VRFVLFYHSLISDWNHAGAHGLRGIATELMKRGHTVRIFEPIDGWSLHNLLEQGGDGVVKAFHATYPRLRSTFYDPINLDLDDVLAEADVVIAHEWNDVGFLRRLGDHRARSRGYKLLLHDAPHRALKQPVEMRERALAYYDGILASSDSLRRMYEDHSWASNIWTWREAVDTNVFRPWPADPIQSRDLTWFGSWGDGERASELDEFLIDPIRKLGLRARFYGARFPPEALRTLRASGIDYGGWIPDFCLPVVLAAGRFTVHVPRRMRTDGLSHTPAIRVLEALACGIPAVSAPWEECGELFTPGSDLLIGHDGPQVERHLVDLYGDPTFAKFIAANGYQTVTSRHTCGHRVQELLAICHELGANEAQPVMLENTATNLRARRRVLRSEPSHAPAAWN
jgi:spore maturation protein CgeB